VKGRRDQIVQAVALAQSAGAASGLEAEIIRFAGALRQLGLPIGSGELLDAAAALLAVDLLDRAQVKLALSATLAKDERAREIILQAFDLYFVTPEERDRRAAQQAADEAQYHEMLEQAQVQLRFQGESLDLSNQQKETYALLSEAQQRRLQDFLAQSSGGQGVDSSFTPLIESIVRGHLERWRRQPPPQRAGEDAAAHGATRGEGDDSLGQDPMLYVDMKEIGPAELAKVKVLIRRLAKRLATRIMRRYRISRRRERVDFRRTIRANLRYGGTPVHLQFKSRRVLKPRIVLLCDVSGSMALYTAFIMQFTHGLTKVVRDVDAFLFAEDLEHVTPRLRQEQDLQQMMADLVGKSAIWGKGTNLATALDHMMTRHRATLTSDALLLVVSDTKTIGVQEAANLLGEVRRRVRGVVWLNTVPRREWPSLPGVSAFGRHATMYECNTLADLERVLQEAITV